MCICLGETKNISFIPMCKLTSKVCAVVDSPILPEFWYKILVDDYSLSINGCPYIESYSCIFSDGLALTISVGRFNDCCWVVTPLLFSLE